MSLPATAPARNPGQAAGNDRLTDALMAQAFAALTASPGARARYDAERARDTEHSAALRKLVRRWHSSVQPRSATSLGRHTDPG